MKQKIISGNWSNPWIRKEEAVELLKVIENAVRHAEDYRQGITFGNPDKIVVELYEKYNSRSYVSSVDKDSVIAIPKEDSNEKFLLLNGNNKDIDVCKGKNFEFNLDIRNLEGYVSKLNNEILPSDILMNLSDSSYASLQFRYILPYFKKEYGGYEESYGQTINFYDLTYNPGLTISVYQFQPREKWDHAAEFGSNIYNRLFSFFNGDKAKVAVNLTVSVKPDKISVERMPEFTTVNLNRLKQEKVQRKHAERIEKMILNYIVGEVNKEII